MKEEEEKKKDGVLKERGEDHTEETLVFWKWTIGVDYCLYCLRERERSKGDSFIVNGVKERERGSLFISGSERLRHKTFCTTSVRET